MALRLNTAIISGWIDNTTPGVTRGGIEVVGMQRPLQLILKGNCWRDLAGTRLDFVNPEPQAQEDVVEALHGLQRGVVGDMSASQKVKALLITKEEMIEYLEANKELPFEWKNCLYLEWFSLANGRVVVEATGFELKLSGHHWELDQAGDRIQREENANALEHFMELITHANEAESQVRDDFVNEADEFEWERRLRVRDTLEEAVEFLSQSEDDDSDDLLDTDLMEGRDKLLKTAHTLQMDVMLYLGNSFLDSGSRGELAMAAQFVFETLDEICPETSEKDLEKGYRIAMLKRSADACNVAIAACNTLEMEDDGFGLIRADIFDLRDMMLDRVRELRGDLDDAQDFKN
ncbi:MAG: hypothetical protein ACSHX6_04800 [Akkermansiaceae bacterium]